MKHIGKFPIGVIGIIDRKLFDVKKKIYMEYNFFIFFAKRLLKFIEYIGSDYFEEKKVLSWKLFHLFSHVEKPSINNPFIFNWESVDSVIFSSNKFFFKFNFFEKEIPRGKKFILSLWVVFTNWNYSLFKSV